MYWTPPFGLLNESWDKNFQFADLEKIFLNEYSTFPMATFLIFHSDIMIPAIFALQNDFQNFTLCTYYTTGKALNFNSAFAYTAQFYTVATKQSWSFTSGEDENDNVAPMMKSNFRCVPMLTRTTSLDGLVVNYLIGEKRFVWYMPLNREFPFWEALFEKNSILRKNL